jgi:3-carboxy-cis,cis-muconate cycloisomerase
MARFEAALASASARAGLIPAAHATVIAEVCAGAAFDAAALAREARIAGALAIPFVTALTKQVAAVSAEAAASVHFGATSQDAMDTAAALCLKPAAERIAALTAQLGDGAAALAARHNATPMLARTLLQPASPVPFGWKAAMWLAPFARSRPRFLIAAEEACALQLGGAAGTLSALGHKGAEVAKRMAEELGLRPAVTWHSARDAFARLGSEMAILTGLAAKIARDVALLMQPEIGEAAEPALPGRGGSSSMPHKRNPAGCLLALEAAARAPGLAATLLGELAPEHERGIGQWQSQWLTLREVACSAASALAAVAEILEGLQVDAASMQRNLERSNGMVFSEVLALRLSRPIAERLCGQAAREGRTLLEVTRSDAEASRLVAPHELEAIFDPQRSFGPAQRMIERVLADWANSRENGP